MYTKLQGNLDEIDTIEQEGNKQRSHEDYLECDSLRDDLGLL